MFSKIQTNYDAEYAVDPFDETQRFMMMVHSVQI